MLFEKELIDNLPNWFKYNLPDFLWIFAFTSFLSLIWGKKLTRENIIYISFPFTFALVHEFGQKFSWFHGTFDVIDLLFYLVGSLLSLWIVGFNKTKIDEQESPAFY